MTDLLIHSMSEFSEIILGILDRAEAQNIAEIGAEYGGMSARLAEFAAMHDGSLTSIDPAPKPEFVQWAAQNPTVRHIAEPSLKAIGTLSGIDAWLIDGDHNWYTVYNELKQIDALCRRDNKPFLAILHDIDWPSGRRDMYYAPEQIPLEFRHDHDFEGGAVPTDPYLHPGRGFRGMGHFAWAKHEGGPRNGVRTAVEDFIKDIAADGREIALAEIPAIFGLGILFSMDAPWSAAIAELVLPYHRNPLIASLERNRLANYLTVLEWQDRTAA
ncbi:class I SAM-dependent methyltransferase [Sphingomonas sp. C3-2]|uniref:class I SAM-dependent methyltransferase n=1 Tax=Sphingomonas sp. C3-2 TaxID=3062169 RepID=UPI00294B5BB9|nr:class I SAM-dependent methyltransferase [Sphingomonas sp. C3-2]WOK36020.1 class I SAM-dependent methyltransferase [Sphingomonas sp. C3-2]